MNCWPKGCCPTRLYLPGLFPSKSCRNIIGLPIFSVHLATGGESFGIVLLEAMASGKPVVATNIPGYASVMTNGDEGLLAKPRDPRSLAEALLTLIHDRPKRQKMAENGLVRQKNTAGKMSAGRS